MRPGLAFVLFAFAACGAREQPRPAPPATTPAPAPAPAPVDGETPALATDHEPAADSESPDDVQPATPIATPLLSACSELTSHQIKATLTRLPDGVLAFGPDAYLAWGWEPGRALELVTNDKRVVLARHDPKPNEPPWFPANVHTAPDGRIVWTVPEGVFVHERGTTRQLAGPGSRSGVIVGDAAYYVKDDTVHVVDARGDRVLLKPKARVDGKVISSYVLRAGGGALGLEAHAEDVKVGPYKWSASVLGWIDRGKLVDARILDTPIGAPDLHGDTYVYTDNVGQTQLFAFKRGRAPEVILAAQTPIDRSWSFGAIHQAHWDGGPLFIGTSAQGIYRVDECKVASVVDRRASTNTAIAADSVAVDEPRQRRNAPSPPRSLPDGDGPVVKPQVGTTILHGNYGDAVAGNRAIIRRYAGDQSTPYLYVPAK